MEMKKKIRTLKQFRKEGGESRWKKMTEKEQKEHIAKMIAGRKPKVKNI